MSFENANAARQLRWVFSSHSVLAALFALSSFACAHGSRGLAHSPLPPGISVSGHGEAQGAPDIARVTIGVETRASVASAATEEATRQMNAIIAAIRQQGVAENDLRTQNFSVNFEQQHEPYPPPPPQQPIPRTAAPGEKTEPAAPAEGPRGFYRVSNTLLVTVRDLDKLGAVLGAATGAGANNIWGIQFEIEDPSQLEAIARQKAMAQAASRAQQLAELAGVKLGKVVHVGEAGSGGGPPGAGYEFSMKAAQADVPVQRGELTVSQDVQVLFAIE